MSPTPEVVAVVGATATGKSDLALDLAEELGGEVVNADSMQLYRGMDIGTNKLPVAERRGIPHHLLDVLEVTVRRPGQWLGVAAKGTLGLERDVAGLQTRGSTEVTVTTEQPLHIQLDGDVVGPARRMHARCLPHAITVRAASP